MNRLESTTTTARRRHACGLILLALLLSLWGIPSSLSAQVVVDDSGKVGIGLTNPFSALTVAGNQANPGSDTLAQIMITGGGGNTNARLLMGYDTTDSKGYIQAVHANAEYKSLLLNPNGGKVGVGTTNPQATLDVNGKIYLNNWVCNSGGGNCLFLDTGNVLRPTYNAGLDLGTPDIRFSTLFLNATGYKPGGGSWSDYSDARLKKNIKNLGSALKRLLKLRGVTYQWKEPEKRGNLTGTQIGMIGQEVEKVFPEWIETEQAGYKVLTFRGFEALTVEALRELKKENESLKRELKQLSARVAELQQARSIALVSHPSR